MIYVLAILSILIGAVGQFLLKLGANRIKSGDSLLSSLLAMIFNINIIIAATCFVTSMVMWVFVLRKLQLSIAYPMVSLGYVIVIILAYLFLKEPLGLYKIAGSLLIIFGVIVINIK